MFIVGLTGGVATGKSTVLEMFRLNGIPSIDADEVARKVLEPGTKAWQEVQDYFGEEVFYPDGKVNRLKLGQLIFGNIEKRRKLNEITHPRIQYAMMKLAVIYFFAGYRYIVMEVPLLFENGNMLHLMHKIITVVCNDECEQTSRLCTRNNLSEEDADRRIRSQMPTELKVAMSDFIIDNTHDVFATYEQVKSIMKILENSKFNWYFRTMFGIAMLSVSCGIGHIIGKLLVNKF